MSKTCDPRILVGAITNKIDAIIAGNNPAQLPVEIGTVTAHDQTFDVLLGVGWSWRSEWQVFKGATNPPGCSKVINGNVGNQLLKNLAHKQAANEKYVDKLLAGIAANPTAATALGNTLLAKVSGAAYFHQTCNDCHGSGQIPCGCWKGLVNCGSCGGSGKGVCPKCQGTRTTYVYVQEQRGNDFFTVLRSQPCWCFPLDCGICRGSGNLVCARCNGRASVDCGSCGATGWFTQVGEAEIYSSIERSLKFPDDAPRTFAAYLRDKSIDWCRDNADYVLGHSFKNDVKGSVTIAGTAPYANVALVVAGQGFSSEAFGTRAEVKIFTPFLDLLLKETVEAIKQPRANVADWFGAVQQSRLLKQLFEQVSNGDKEAVQAACRLSHGAASQELLVGAEAAIKAGLKRVGRKAIDRTWLIGLLVAVAAVPLVAASGVWSRLAAGAHLSMAQSLWVVALGPLVFLLPTWLTAHLLWKSEAKRAFLGKTPAYGHRHGWRLVSLTILLGAWNVGAVESFYARGEATATSMGYGDRLVEMERNASAFISTVNADRLVKLWKGAFHTPIAPQAQQPQADAERSSPKAIKTMKPVMHNNSFGNTPAPVLAALLGTWRGTYTCNQGASAAELVISQVTEQGKLHGRFYFFNLPNQHNVDPGEYTVSATYDASRNGFSFRPVKWVLAVPGYSMVGFNVRLESENKLIGRITFPGCRGISLEK